MIQEQSEKLGAIAFQVRQETFKLERIARDLVFAKTKAERDQLAKELRACNATLKESSKTACPAFWGDQTP